MDIAKNKRMFLESDSSDFRKAFSQLSSIFTKRACDQSDGSIKYFDKILVIRLGGIGDVIYSIPTLIGLKEKYPGCKITYLTLPQYAELLNGQKYIDKVISIPDFRGENKDFLNKKLLNSINQARQEKFDLVINLHHFRETAILTSLIAQYSLVLGCYYKNGNYYVTNKPAQKLLEMQKNRYLRRENKEHLADIFCAIAEVSPSEKIFDLKSDNESVRYIKNLISRFNSGGKNIIALHTGSVWPSKCWPESRFCELIERIKSFADIEIVLLGGTLEIPKNEKIKKHLNFPVLDLSGKCSLKQALALLDYIKILISGDTGVMHMACVGNVDCICLFGPTSSLESRPYCGSYKIMKVDDLKCSPCFFAECPKKENKLECLEKITSNAVFQAFKEFYKKHE